VTGLHRALDRLLEAEGQPDVEIAEAGSCLPKLVLDHLPYAGAFLHRDEWLRAKLVERDGAPGERMCGQAREHDLVAEERLVNDRATAPRRADDAELELAVGNEINHGVRVRDGEHNGEIRMAALELGEEGRHECAARSGRSSDRQCPFQVARLGAGDLFEELLLECEHPLRAPVEPEAGLGRLDPAAGAVEKLLAEPFLERADLQADCGLGHAETRGSLGEASLLDDSAEGGELARVHKEWLSDARLRVHKRCETDTDARRLCRYADSGWREELHSPPWGELGAVARTAPTCR
jgi:hypothetical protein